MPDEGAPDEAVQQHDQPATTQEGDERTAVASTGDTQVDTNSAREEPSSETQSEDTPNPLDPEGKRFKQVWARAKTAEQTAVQLKEELQREREERIRFEERLKAADTAKEAAKQPEYTWAQLESAIEAGTITRAWAQDYREKLVEQRATETAEKRLESKLRTSSSEATIVTELERYKKAMPSLNEVGTTENQKVVNEYTYLTQRLGYPPTLQTQLAAARAAVGDIDSVERTATAKRTTHKETYVETQSGTGRPSSQAKGKDPVANLDPVLKDHYAKMIKAGRYGGWEDVTKELNWVKPSLAPKRR